MLSDEIYSRICYGEPPASITQFPGMLEKTIILDGFSKTYAMTGWRMGYGVMPEWLVEAVNKLMVNSNSCTASFTQRAGIAALTGPRDCVDAMVAEFRRRRDAIRRRPEPDSRLPLRRCRAGRSMLSPMSTGTGMSSKELADYAALRSRRRRPRRRLLRRIRRRLHPLQLRQFPGEIEGGRRQNSESLGALGVRRRRALNSGGMRRRPPGITSLR